MGILFAVYSGLACRPADILIALLVFPCVRGTPILAGGIGVARLVVGAVFVFVGL